MRESRKWIALILSVVLCLASAFPAIGAEVFGDGEATWENHFGDDFPEASVENPEESNGDFPSEEAEGAVFSSEEADWGTGEEEEEFSEFGGDDSQELLQNPEEEHVVCKIPPIRRPDAFTPIGTGCDTPSPEEIIAEAGPGLFTAGEESEGISESDEAALVKAAEDLRKAMVRRSGKAKLTLKLSFEIEDDDWFFIVYSLLLMAFEETGNSWEGDYLRWQFQETRESLVSVDTEGAYQIELPFVFYTTYAQEQKVTQAVQTALSDMQITDKTTPYLKIKKIYDYVCSTVVYDEIHESNEDYVLQFTAYGGIIDKTAVCQGYAVLLYRMLMEAGIDNRMIPSERHIWNLVYLRGNYYNVDATWDSQVLPEHYLYFLKGSQSFEKDLDHIREKDDLFCDYDSVEFRNAYPTSEVDYVLQAEDTPEGGECSHEWDGWKTIVKADCVSEGIKKRCCRKCGEEAYDVIPLTAHKWKYSPVEQKNVHKAVCSVCGISKTQNCTFINNLCTKCMAQRIPDPVQITGITSAGYNRVKITWSPVEGATGYEISYLKGKSWKVLKKTTQTTYLHTSNATYPVKTGVTCYFRLRAYCSVKNKTTYGAYSSKVGGKAKSGSPAIISVEARAYNKITIKWKKAAGATHYLIYRKKGEKWERIATVNGGDITSYTHTSSKAYPIEVGTSYTYTVRSYTESENTFGLYDKKGKSVKTALGSISLTVSKCEKGLKNSWKRVNGATGYQLQRYSGGKWSVVKSLNSRTLSYVDTTARKGASYQYRVRPYRVFKGKRVYGKYSSVKTAKR